MPPQRHVRPVFTAAPAAFARAYATKSRSDSEDDPYSDQDLEDRLSKVAITTRHEPLTAPQPQRVDKVLFDPNLPQAGSSRMSFSYPEDDQLLPTFYEAWNKELNIINLGWLKPQPLSCVHLGSIEGAWCLDYVKEPLSAIEKSGGALEDTLERQDFVGKKAGDLALRVIAKLDCIPTNKHDSKKVMTTIYRTMSAVDRKLATALTELAEGRVIIWSSALDRLLLRSCLGLWEQASLEHEEKINRLQAKPKKAKGKKNNTNSAKGRPVHDTEGGIEAAMAHRETFTRLGMAFKTTMDDLAPDCFEDPSTSDVQVQHYYFDGHAIQAVRVEEGTHDLPPMSMEWLAY